MDFWYQTLKSSLRVYLALFVESVVVQGKQALPSGPKIIVANHANVSDGFILPFILPDRLHFLIQAETFEIPVLGKWLKLADQIPVVIGQGRAALDAARDRLMAGHSVVIFPEGRLNHARGFHRAGAGAALLALESGVPVIPVGFYVPGQFTRAIISNKFHQRESVGRWQIRGQCIINFGEPWLPTLPAQVEANYRMLRKLTEELMARIIELVEGAKKNTLNG